MDECISLKAAIAYIREQSEECQKAFEELGGESGIYADAYNDLAEDFHSIPTVDAVVVTRCKDCKKSGVTEFGKRYCKEPMGSFYGCIPVEDDYFCSGGRRRDEQ